jgi:hypothetical protein
MKYLPAPLRTWLPVLLSVAVASLALSAAPPNDEKPSITLRASPNTGFAPMRVVFTAELKGGKNDYEQYYCPTVEWDIISLDGKGDGNKSEQKLECDPYEPGKSEIRRRYVREQVFKFSGEYNVRFNLKQRGKVVGGGRTSVKVRGGFSDGLFE